MSTDRPLDVLIVGASGVFGSRLAALAAREPRVRLALGGRRRAPLEALASELGCTIQCVDRDRVSADEIARYRLVVDCAGPFQGSTTRLVEACIEAGVDYVDLADSREFVCSIGRFDLAAKGAGIAVISGASSIPALSHAVLDALTAGWRRIDAIRIGIFPGNRAPRGRSVVDAILSYVGKSVRVFKDGSWQAVPGWALSGRCDCGSAGLRWASICDTPEQELLVRRYRPTRSAEFVAGLELPLLHIGLWLLSVPVRWGWVSSLRPWGGALLWIAQQLRPLGSDRGAMVVEAEGADGHGTAISTTWLLEATANRGPLVPVVPALALIRRLRDGARPPAGSYACSGVLKLQELEAMLDELGIGHSSVPLPLAAAA
ncbi:MAG TPA: saccharopine dehydrogenase NADP-binding domain-containing protein [Sphingomicrobium sp.]|nr:saccharopine dehydrogenase NADP-binding domain-containing protein [Sphingomicrobium sp.]